MKTIEDLKESLCELGYEDTVVLEDYDYITAVVGITDDGRLIYSYEKMIEYLMDHEDYESEEEAIEWIDYNTIRALPYAGQMAPIIMYEQPLMSICEH